MTLTPEILAIGGQFIPWPEDGFHIRPPEGPPPGLRLSENCGACRILDYFLDRKNFVNDGVSLAGHMYADLFIEAFLSESQVMIEEKFEWCEEYNGSLGGISGMDALILSEGDPYRAHYELKTTSKEKGNVKPSAANRRQVIRQRVVIGRSGVNLSELSSVIFIIEKSGNKTGKVSEAFEIIPTDEEYEDAKRDIDLTIQIYQDIIDDGIHPYDHPLLKSLRYGTCTRCFRLNESSNGEAIAEVLSESVLTDLRRLPILKSLEQTVRDKVRDLIEIGTELETDDYKIRHTESGRLFIDIK